MLEWAGGRVSALFLEVERDRNSSTPELNPHIDKGDKPSLFQLLTGRANPCVQERTMEVASPCLRRGERIIGLFLGDGHQPHHTGRSSEKNPQGRRLNQFR